MQIKTLVKIVRSTFQDSLVRIPFFASFSQPTLTIAIPLQSYDQAQVQRIEKTVADNRDVLLSQHKLYYSKETPNKTIIVVFNSVQTATKFYENHAKSYDLSVQKTESKIQSNSQPKFQMYFCKDIAETGTNMAQILYSPGKISVHFPESATLRNIIDQIAKFILVEGIRGEQQVSNCKSLVFAAGLEQVLDFMDPKYLASEAYYYRWRVYSYLQGDGEKSYRGQPFQTTLQGAIYYPPLEGIEKYSLRVLNMEERKFITKLLKYHIEEAMTFCIANTTSAIQICSLIAINVVQTCLSLSAMEEDAKSNRPASVKHLVSLFFLVSDILYNSPSTVYRDILFVLLPYLVDKAAQVPEALGKIKQIVDVWNRKFTFEQQFMSGLNLICSGSLPSHTSMLSDVKINLKVTDYEQIITTETPHHIEQLCWKYGLPYYQHRTRDCLRNLATLFSVSLSQESDMDVKPEVGPHDGEPLSQHDLKRIQNKMLKVVSCEDVPVKFLFNRNKASYDRD